MSRQRAPSVTPRVAISVRFGVPTLLALKDKHTARRLRRLGPRVGIERQQAHGASPPPRTPRGPQTADLAAERETVVVERSGVAA